jgi:hypothetical protein
MSTAENRLSLGRRRCAEQRRYLAALELLAQRLYADERRLRAELQRAGVAQLASASGAGQSVGAGHSAGKLAESLIERHGQLARSIAEIDAQIVEAGASLGVAERELKRHELASVQHAANVGMSGRRRLGRAPSASRTSSLAGPKHGS